ncbi:osteoclast-associated immunoglobulin-like receptor isoform X3 [Equus przewalskii]|uniref:Osteoclast-associated immunoglobulin-like receptor isoform X3 n=1 Tax=Equus przewalskii TaxID=9798 RepID=A0ABM4QJ68_EQUPR
MALVLLLQLLSLWRLCHMYTTPTVPPALYPKPRLGAQPAAVVTPGVNVTLRCRAPLPAWRFELFKSGEIESILQRDVFLELAEFFLEEVTTEQGGSYRCCYKKRGWRPGVCSQLSDALELLVTDELPAPTLVALPGPVVAPGANVSLRCAGRWRGMSFALYREGEAAPVQYRDSPQPWADFPLLGASAAGTYSCYYHTPSSPYVLSRRSEPLVISLEGEGPRDPAPSPSSPRPRSPDTQPPAPPPSDPGVRAPSPSSLRPRGPGPQPLLPQTQGSGPPAPPPSDQGVRAPSPSSPRPRRPGLLPPPPSDPRVAVPPSSIPLSFVSPSPP